jgi:hypothetical protein
VVRETIAAGDSGVPSQNQRWTAKWEQRWPKEDRFALGTVVAVSGYSGGNFTIVGYDFAGRRYRVLRIIPDPPSRTDIMVDPSLVNIP